MPDNTNNTIIMNNVLINDELAIILETYSYVAYSNKEGFFLYDFKNSKMAYSILSKAGEEYTQKKFITFAMNDYIFSTNSLKQVLEINITCDQNMNMNNIQHRFYDIPSLPCVPTIFDINFYGDSINLESDADKKINGISYDNSLCIFFAWGMSYGIQMWKLDNTNSVLINHMYHTTHNYVRKIEYFEANLIPQTYLSERERYFIFASEVIELYKLEKEGFVNHYKILPTDNTKSVVCNSFYLENLYSTNEAYLYSIWNNGSLYIHSLKNKILIKEVKSFNLLHAPLYSVTFINEKYLLIGSEGIMFLVNHANEKLATTRLKMKGKVIGVKLVTMPDKKDVIFTYCMNGKNMTIMGYIDKNDVISK